MDLAVVDDLDDLFLDRLADSLQLLGASVERELSHLRRRLAHALSRPAIGRDAKAVVPVDLAEISEQVELIRDVGIPRQGRGHTTMI